jgi:hypothetical protein
VLGGGGVLAQAVLDVGQGVAQGDGVGVLGVVVLPRGPGLAGLLELAQATIAVAQPKARSVAPVRAGVFLEQIPVDAGGVFVVPRVEARFGGLEEGVVGDGEGAGGGGLQVGAGGAVAAGTGLGEAQDEAAKGAIAGGLDAGEGLAGEALALGGGGRAASRHHGAVDGRVGASGPGGQGRGCQREEEEEDPQHGGSMA